MVKSVIVSPFIPVKLETDGCCSNHSQALDNLLKLQHAKSHGSYPSLKEIGPNSENPRTTEISVVKPNLGPDVASLSICIPIEIYLYSPPNSSIKFPSESRTDSQISYRHQLRMRSSNHIQ